jgi:hydrogenase nickel incorporation protein HypA/HybF
MHELSAAQSIFETVQTTLQGRELHSVKSVKLRIGKLSGIVPDSLDFCFTALTMETLLQGVVLEIELIPFVLKCRTCKSSFESETGIVVCPTCCATDAEVLSGTELQVVGIELNDEEEATTLNR